MIAHLKAFTKFCKSKSSAICNENISLFGFIPTHSVAVGLSLCCSSLRSIYLGMQLTLLTHLLTVLVSSIHKYLLISYRCLQQCIHLKTEILWQFCTFYVHLKMKPFWKWFIDEKILQNILVTHVFLFSEKQPAFCILQLFQANIVR